MKLVNLAIKSIDKVYTDEKDSRDYSVIVLEDPISKKTLTMKAHLTSADHITRALSFMESDKTNSTERATTYSLMSSIMSALDVSVSYAVIEHMPGKKTIYDCKVCVTKQQPDGKTYYAILSGKPTDIIPIAIYQNADIRASEEILNEP